MVRVKVLLFAQVRDWFQQREVEVVLRSEEWHSGEGLKQTLLAELERHRLSSEDAAEEKLQREFLLPRTLMLAINEEMVDSTGTITLRDGDIVSIIPPVSGG